MLILILILVLILVLMLLIVDNDVLIRNKSYFDADHGRVELGPC